MEKNYCEETKKLSTYGLLRALDWQKALCEHGDEIGSDMSKASKKVEAIEYELWLRSRR